jgi:monoamine oxidase
VGANNPLHGVDEWLAEASAPLDVSMHDWLASRGLDDRTINLCWTTNPYFGSSAYDISALQCLYNDVWTRAISQGSPATYSVVGGNQKLPFAMAKKLKSEVHLDREVVAIQDDGKVVEVACRDGSRYRARTVVCSIPFSVLRHVHFDPSLVGPQAEAVDTLPYMVNTLVFFTPKARYWESDGLSPTMWTDGPAGTVMGQRFGKDENEVTAIVANPRGIVATWLDRLPPQDAIALVKAEIERLRPAAKGALADGAIHSWARDPFAGGDWAIYAPGQIERFARKLATPHGRVHFCGEHTAKANRGMEGAFESAERVVLEVSEKL